MKKYLALTLATIILTACTGHLTCGLGADAQASCKDKQLALSSGLNGNYDSKVEKLEQR